MTKKSISAGTVHKMPADLRKALTSNPVVVAKWNSLTPLARNEWICWTITVKTPKTRAQHIQRACLELKEGKRRPCCWYGCIHRTDKAVSPSVQKVVLGKQSKSK